MTQSGLTLSGLAPKFGSRKKKRRLGLGDGSGLGKTAGRGQKGQTSRSGDGKMVGFEGGQNPLLRRIPKRGFRNTAFRTAFQVVSLADVVRVFKNTAEVSLEALRVHGLVKGQAPVKVLGDGAVEKPIKIQAHAFSKSAQEKIQKAGGTVEVVAQAV